MPKPSVYGLSREEMNEVCAATGAEKYRAGQVWDWLYIQGVEEWESMSNVPSTLREKLEEQFSLFRGQIVDSVGDPGGTTRILVELADGEQIEEVIIPTSSRSTVCVSSQVGCKFGCAFCASGKGGFARNLSAGEMVAQVLIARDLAGDEDPDEDTRSPWDRLRGKKKDAGAPLTNVVFMGIGEPFDNYDEVLKAIRIMNDDDGINIGARRITISTCGVVPGIERLAGEGIQVELSVSLHSADCEKRSQMMPVNNIHPLEELLPACRDYFSATNRLVTFEYVLVRGVNDSKADAEELGDLLSLLTCRVNLIPLSYIEEFDAAASSTEVADMFMNILHNKGVNATLRASKGGNVKAACGQLRARH